MRPCERFALARSLAPQRSATAKGRCRARVPTGCCQKWRLRRCLALTYSRDGFGLAPSIHPFLTATHHANSIEIGSILKGVDHG